MSSLSEWKTPVCSNARLTLQLLLLDLCSNNNFKCQHFLKRKYRLSPGVHKTTVLQLFFLWLYTNHVTPRCRISIMRWPLLYREQTRSSGHAKPMHYRFGFLRLIQRGCVSLPLSLLCSRPTQLLCECLVDLTTPRILEAQVYRSEAQV